MFLVCVQAIGLSAIQDYQKMMPCYSQMLIIPHLNFYILYIQHSFCGSGNPMPSKSIYFHNKQVQTVTTGTFHTDASLTGATN